MTEYKEFPQSFSQYYGLLDKENPYRTQLTGWYRGKLDIGDGKSRPYAVYYPVTLEFSCRSVTLLLPENADPAEFAAQSGWQELADRDNILLLAAGGKDSSFGTAEDESYLAAVLKELKNRRYMDTKQPVAYLAAYGAAAAPAHSFLLHRPYEYAGAVFAGNPALRQEDIDFANGNCYPHSTQKLSTIPCPVMFSGSLGWRTLPEVMSYWRQANDSLEGVRYADGESIFIPDRAVPDSPIEHRPCAEIRLHSVDDPCDPSETERFWRFLSATVRGTGINYGDLHPFISPEKMGMLRRERYVDGYKRHWYEYVPEQTEALTDGALPMVVYLHGGSASTLTDGINHMWVSVAKERGFVLLTPAGTMRVMDDMMPHPAWNAAQRKDHMDDEKFIREMIGEVCSRLPIDRGRIYIVGHSMGSAMAQHLALAMPEIFAACAGNSGVTKGGFMGEFDFPGARTDLDIPVWIQMGEFDYGGGTMENNPAVAAAIHYWIDRYALSDPEHPGVWRSGRYMNREWSTASGVPMLRLTTTREKPHCITPQDPFFYYDEFFCQWSRTENGTLLYKNIPVKDIPKE